MKLRTSIAILVLLAVGVTAVVLVSLSRREDRVWIHPEDLDLQEVAGGPWSVRPIQRGGIRELIASAGNAEYRASLRILKHRGVEALAAQSVTSAEGEETSGTAYLISVYVLENETRAQAFLMHLASAAQQRWPVEGLGELALRGVMDTGVEAVLARAGSACVLVEYPVDLNAEGPSPQALAFARTLVDRLERREGEQ